MTTNRFGANCAVCGAAVAPGTGTVRGEVGARAVTHTSCEPLVRHTRSFTVRRIEHDPETLFATDGRDERRRRRLAVATAAGVLGVAGIAALFLNGASNEGTTRTTGSPISTSAVGIPTTPSAC